jgi:hypothetical protein
MLTHSQRLEKWLGAERVENVSRNFLRWYGPPVAMGGVPGAVFVTGGGDFIGEYRGPRHASAVDRAMDILREEKFRRYKRARYQRGAFSGLSALIAAKTGGKSVTMLFNKTGTAPTAANGAMDLWMAAGQPAAGSAGAALPGGTSTTNATAGNLGYINAVVNANTGHFVNASCEATVAGNDLLLIDQQFRGAVTMTSTSTQSVTGANTNARYTSQTDGALNYAGGNFVYPAVTGTVLASVAHNWTVCQYTNQAGTTGQSIPSIAGVSACAKNQIDLAVGNWFMPLASGDTGVYQLTQVQLSADVTSGTADIVVAHPIAVFSCPVASLAMNIDGVTSAFNLQQIYDNACLSLLELPKVSTTATTYSGIVLTVSE